MLDRAGRSNDLFRFSTTALQWEQLDADLVSGSPPSARHGHTMAVVGGDLIVFGGYTYSGEEARCAVWPPSGVMSDIAPTIVPRAAVVRARPHGGVVTGLDRAIEHVVYFSQDFLRSFWYTLRRKSGRLLASLLRGFPVCTTVTSSK